MFFYSKGNRVILVTNRDYHELPLNFKKVLVGDEQQRGFVLTITCRSYFYLII